MWLADISIRRPVFATMIVMGFVLLGIVSYPSIGVDLFPKIDFPIVNITTVLKGAGPEVIDIDVTDRIEEAINTINGVKTISSTSSEGVSRVTVEFVLERDLNQAIQDVREKISLIRAKLPKDVDEPTIEKVDPDAVAVLWVALTGEKTARELSTYADEVLKEQIQKINGVGAIRLVGLRVRQVRLWLDSEKMAARQVTAHDVFGALSRQNVELPGGRIESGTKEYSIKITGEMPNVQAFNDIIVSEQKVSVVRLRDIGRVEDGMDERRSTSRFNGTPSIGLAIQKQSGTNTVEVVDRVKNEIEKIKKTLPQGMKLEVSFDQSDFIKRSIREVQHHLIYGGIFAVIAVLLFLRNLRITLISAIAIPTSIISTVFLMNVFGFTFNNMTMLALSLSIGILIDDAIIVIENIHRHMELGKSAREAAHIATEEIGTAVVATTLAIVAIFLPVAFMKGIIGRFFLQFAITVVFAVLMSMFVSFTLTPMMASKYLKHELFSPEHKKKTMLHGVSDALERVYKWIEGYYKKLLETALGHRALVVVLAFLIFGLSLFLTKFIGKEFMPSEDQSRFIVRLKSPIEYSVPETDSMFKKAEEIVRGFPEVTSLFYAQGLSGDPSSGFMFIGLKPQRERKKSQDALMMEIRKKLKVIPGLKGSAEQISMVGGGMRNVPIQYSITGRNLADLQKYSKDVIAQFAKIPGIVDVDTSVESVKPEVHVVIDRDRAGEIGVDIATIAESVNFLISGEITATRYKDIARGRRYDVRMRLNPEDRSSPSDLGRMYVRAKDGKLVRLSSLVKIDEAGGPSVINRLDRQRAVTVFANLEGKPLGEAKNDLEAIAAKVLPPDYTGKFKGAAEIMGDSFKYLMFAMVLGIIMAYMVLAAQYESFIHPITVLLSMPFSFIGAFGLLLILGKTLNMFSLIGMILLMGLVKKNAILIVDYTNTLRAGGLERRKALLEAGPVRLRPIMMTTVAMIFGMMPIAIGFGEGSETRSPMAIAVIGGLMSSLFLSLVVVPVAYDLFDQAKERLFGKTDYSKQHRIETTEPTAEVSTPSENS